MKISDGAFILARRLGIGKFLLRTRALGYMRPSDQLQVFLAKKRYLGNVFALPPVACGDEVECHMLLHHARVREGAWCLYSFAYFSGKRCRFVIHDDGSLAEEDCSVLSRLFPGIQIISREKADLKVTTYLKSHGYSESIRFRDTLVFGLKLYDPFLFLTDDSFVLLDSDVLFYSEPTEVLEALKVAVPKYSVDNGYRYVLPKETMRSALGRECIHQFNPGVVAAHKRVLDFAKTERWLMRPEFWASDGVKGHYYGELTLWAMNMSLAGALPLSEKYAICPPFPGDMKTVSGHYCGGGYWASLFYSRGIPYIANRIVATASYGWC